MVQRARADRPASAGAPSARRRAIWRCSGWCGNTISPCPGTRHSRKACRPSRSSQRVGVACRHRGASPRLHDPDAMRADTVTGFPVRSVVEPSHGEAHRFGTWTGLHRGPRLVPFGSHAEMGSNYDGRAMSGRLLRTISMGTCEGPAWKGSGRCCRRLLRGRFGVLSPETVERVGQASVRDLEAWAKNVLDAGTLAEAFDTNRQWSLRLRPRPPWGSPVGQAL